MYPEDSSRAKSGANQVAKIKPNASGKLGVEGRAQKMSRQASSAEMTGASTNAASRLTKAGRTTKSAKRTSYCNTTALREKSSMRNITPQDLYNPTPNLENIRRNLQEFAKIRKMSVGETTAPLHNASNYHNPGYNPYFNPNLPMANGSPNYSAPQQGSQASVPQPTNNTPPPPSRQGGG